MSDDAPAQGRDGTVSADDLAPAVHVGADEEVHTGRYRLFRVLPAVPHLNLFDVGSRRLYTVHDSGYREELQTALDDLRTGDCVTATLVGDPDAPESAWRLARIERQPDESVAMAFAADIEPAALPDAVRAAARRDRDPAEPIGTTLALDGEPVGEAWLQPREPLPDGVFLPTVLTGLVPMEPWFDRLPEVGEPTAEALVLDTAPPAATRFDRPYGVLAFLTERGRPLGDDLRERYDLPLDRDADTRPDFDPYQ